MVTLLGQAPPDHAPPEQHAPVRAQKASPAELVGREREISEVTALLAGGRAGVLLHGGPGMGKSRLAASAADAYARLTGAGTAVLTAAERERDRQRGPRERREWAARLVQGLAGRDGVRPLLVVDDLTPGAALLSAALAYAGAAVLATARKPVPGAELAPYPVGPLPVPLDCSALDPEGLARVPSVVLFTACLRALNPGFVLRRHNQQAIARTCAELRGVPGALCRAARVAALEGPEVFDADPGTPGLVPLLDAYGPPGAPDPRAPGGAPAGPGGALTATQRELLECARHFHGGFGPEALREAAGVPLPEFPAALEGLLDRHLLTLSALPSGRLGGFSRVRLHTPLGTAGPVAGSGADGDSANGSSADEGGANKGSADEGRAAHARYYLRLAHACAGHIRDGDQDAGLVAFRAEERNIRAALDTLVAAGRADDALDLADHARAYWYATGSPFTWAGRLAALPRPASADARQRLGLLLAEAGVRAGEPETALALLAQADEDEAGRTPVTARHLHVKGLAALAHAPAEGLACLRRAAARHRADGDEAAACRVGLEASLAAFLHGRAADAVALAGEVLPAALRRRDTLTTGTALLHLSVYASADGRAAVADTYYERAMAHLRTLCAPAVLGAFTTLLGSPLQAGVTARATAAARLTGAFFVSRAGLLGEPADPDFTVADAEQRLRGLLDERDFATALREGAATPLPDLLRDFATRPAADGGRAPFPPAPDAGAAAAAGPLTPRQTQVSLLIAHGLSNKQIARRLEISEWTVVNHIRETMKKLGCTSRVGIAGWVHSTASPLPR